MIDRQRGWLVGLTLILALFQVGLVVRTLQIPAELAAQIQLILPLELVLSSGWALIFAITAVNLVRQRPRARCWAIGLIGGFVIYHMARLLLFAQADYDRNRLSFIMIVTTLLVALLVVVATKQTE